MARLKIKESGNWEYVGYGPTGEQGFSGFGGISGYSGYSGESFVGASGFSGISGYSGYSGISGYSGQDGAAGTSGFSGISGYSGYSGIISVAPGTSGNVLTSNGTDWTSAAAGEGAPQIVVNTLFETAGRFTTGNGGGGIRTWNSSGVLIDSSATQNSYSRVYLPLVNQDGIYASNTTFSCGIDIATSGTDYEWCVCVGIITTTGTAHSYTQDHYGFKADRTSSGAVTYSATNANNTNETATSFALTGVLANSFLYAVKTGTTDIKYYQGRVLKATHTTNLPSSIGNYGTFLASINNKNVASQSRIQVAMMAYTQDAK